MRILEQVPRHEDADDALAAAASERDCADRDCADLEWADQTRRVLTSDLLRRAAQAGRGESQVLRLRALHLNLPLVGEVAERLELTQAQREAAEHNALDGLVEAMEAFDADSEVDFADFAVTFVEQHILAHLPRPTLRLTQPRQSMPEVGGPGGNPAHPRTQRAVRLAVRRLALVIAGSHTRSLV